MGLAENVLEELHSEGLSSFDLTQVFLSKESPASKHFWKTIDKYYFIPQLMRQQWGKEKVAAQLLPTSSLLKKKKKHRRPHKYAGSAHTQKNHQKRLQSLTLADAGGLCQLKLQAKAEVTSTPASRFLDLPWLWQKGLVQTSLAMVQSSFLLTVARKAS